MSKRVQEKIKQKHFDTFKFTNRIHFEELLAQTIGSCMYLKSLETINFIAYIEKEKIYILYSLKNEKHHIVCNTIFLLRKSTLKKYYTDSTFKLFRKDFEETLKEYLN